MGLFRHPASYLVVSNALFWGLPLAINQIQGMGFQRSLADPPPPSADLSRSLDGLVAAPMAFGGDPLLPVPSPASQLVPQHLAGVSSPNPLGANPDRLGWNPTALEEPAVAMPLTLQDQLSGADGLGGVLSIQGPQEPLMPIAARAERLQLQRLGDPLAALPLHWREPLRRELGQGKPLSNVATVRLPVRALRERQEVPVIVDDHGRAEGLVMPRDPRVGSAVEGWAARQRAAKPGTVQVVVVAVEPLDAPEEPATATLAAAPVGPATPPPPLPPLPGASL